MIDRAGTDAAPRKILVAAIGNPDRGDDGVGMLVADSLTGRLPPDVALVTRRGDIFGLIEDWAGFDALICADAAAPAGAPGRIHRIDAATGTLPVDLSFQSSHAFGLAEAIALGRVLQSLPETVIVYAVEGAGFDSGAPVTPAVAAAAAAAATCILKEIARLRRHESEGMCHA